MYKKILFFIWLLGLLCFGVFYWFHQDLFTPESMQHLFSQNLYWGLGLYFLLGTIRGFTLFPSTPMVLAGALVFPPLPLYIVNLFCVITSSTIVYFWGQFLGFDTYFERKYPHQVHALQKALEKRELPILVGWSFFPLVPTDMICYAGEIMRIKLWKCLVGVLIGEGIICALYIWGVDAVW